ncbi:MAG: tetraether lipid synthase Tes [Thermoplasmata archaeon]
MRVIQQSKLKKGLPKETLSICPVCKKVIPATIYEENGKVMYKKTCPEHGEFKDIYFGDVDVYLRYEKFAIDGVGVQNPIINGSNCPYDCGLCVLHYSHTALANIDLTNRCNLKCPICFANANAAGYVYEPTFEQVVKMMEVLRNEKPVPTPAVQFAGGEPTIYPKFLEVIAKAKELGFAQIQVATNGVRIAHEPDFAQKMLDAGLHTVYLQFDGFKDSTYIKTRGRPGFLKEKLQAIEYLRNTKPKPLATVLVPVIVKGVNDDEVGQIIEFALKNLDVIRSVNYQPVSFAGRIPQDELIVGRYTQGDLIRDLINQTPYFEKDDFFPIPVAALFSELASQILNKYYVAFTSHPHCGTATYLLKDYDQNKIIPITRFIDVEGLWEELIPLVMQEKFEKRTKVLTLPTIYRIFKKYYDAKNAPSHFKLKEILDIFQEGTKESLGKLHWDSLFIGAMHFQDEYNYDLERLKRCVIHYATPDGRIIPFCAYNSGPVYRTEIEKKFSISLEEYRQRHGTVVGVEGL